MKAASLLVVAAVCVVAAYAASNTPLAVEKGFFPGRSGNIIIDTQQSRRTPTVAFLDATGHMFRRRTSAIATPSSIPVWNVADVIGRTLGMTPFHSEYVASYLTNDVFHTPHANILISVIGLGKEDVESLQLQQIGSILRNPTSSLVFNIADSTVPYTPLAESVSISTASTPSVHGIVAPSWLASNGMRVEAFLNPTSATAAEVANLATVLAQAMPGQARVFSASSNPQYAMSHCVHAKILSALDADDASRVSCVALDEQGSFVAMAGPAEFALSGDSIQSAFSSATFGSVSASFDSSRFVVDGVEFDITVPEYYALFAELHYLQSIVERATAEQGGHPHLHAITIAALEGIAASDGASSATFAAAAKLVDSVVPELVRRFTARYTVAADASPRCVLELALLPSAAVPNSAVPALERRLTPVFERYHLTMPVVEEASMHVVAEASTMRSLCDELDKAASIDGYKVYCPLNTASSSFSAVELSSSARIELQALAASTNSTVKPARVQRYQIILWLSIIMVFTVIFAVYNIAFQENRKDTLLYSKFNPNWGKKQH